MLHVRILMAQSRDAGCGRHYNGNAETYMLVGDAMGKSMIELLKEAKADAD